MMAMNAARQWRSSGLMMMVKMKRGLATESSSSSSEAVKKSKYAVTGEFAPVFVVAGFVSVAIFFGIHTAKQQLLHAPGNYISKKKRESFPEVDMPDSLAAGSRNFINKSFLRKVARIQHDSPPLLACSRNTPETLKSVGVKPRSQS